MRSLTCHACGGAMKRRTISTGNCAGIALALIVFAVGVAVFILIPVVGWVVGPLIVIVALFMGGKRQKVWQCRKCRAVIARA